MTKRIFGFLLGATVWLLTSAATPSKEVKDHLTLGNSLAKKGDYQNAVKEYEKALKADKKNPDTQRLLALTYGRMKKLDKALDHAKDLIKIDPSYASYLTLGQVRAAREEFESAIEAFNKAEALSPESYEVAYQKGIVYASRKKFEQAVDAYEHALKLNSKFGDAHVGLAGAYYGLGERDKVLEQIEKLKELGRTDLADGVKLWLAKKDAASPHPTA